MSAWLSPACASFSVCSSLTAACATTTGKVPAPLEATKRTPSPSPTVASSCRTAVWSSFWLLRVTYLTVKSPAVPAPFSAATK
jgi:hypothetical protein